MSESDFWIGLEFRICRELDRIRTQELRGLWCDGLEPQLYDLNGQNPQIVGKAWMMRSSTKAEPPGIEDWRPLVAKRSPRRASRKRNFTPWGGVPAAVPKQVDWSFVLLLPDSMRSRDAIDWTALFPADEFSGWLTIDVEHHQVRLDLATTFQPRRGDRS